MKKLSFVILLLLPLISFGQAEKPYRSIIIDSLKALNGGRVDVKDTLLLDSLAVYNTDLSSQYTSRSLVDSAFVGVAMSGMVHDPVTLSGTPDYITLSGQDIVRGLIDLSTDITGTTTATSISDFDTEVSNNASVTANTAKVTNVTTNLSEGSTTNTTVDVNSSDGSNATLVAASASRAGVMTKAKFDEVVINNSKVTNATHTGDVSGSGALTIASKAVEIGMLDDGTDGELITWDATGVAATVSTGNSGQVLTSNGVGTAPTFQTDGGDGDGIYDGNGSLTANPTIVTQGANKLKFTSTVVDGFSVDGTTFSVDANNGRVGIGTIAPLVTLHVKASIDNEGIRLDAPDGDIAFDVRVADTDGAILRLYNASGTEKVLIRGGTGGGNSFFTGNALSIGTTVATDLFSVRAVSDGDGISINAVDGSLAFELGAFNSAGGRFRIFNGSGVNKVQWRGDGVASFVLEGNTGFGFESPTARLNVRGVNAAPTSDALLIEDNAGTDLMRIKNNGDVITHQALNFHSDTSVTNDTYGIVEPLLIAYVTGMNMYVDISVGNTGSATLQINALSAITIKKLHDQDLVTGDIESGQIIHVIYDGTNFQMLSQLAQ